MSRVENLVADDHNELVWLRFKRLTNARLCEQLLRDKQGLAKTSLAREIVQRKAIGLASVIDSGLGYWEQNKNRLNSWVLSRYYALLQMTIAEQVASVKNSDDLGSVQRHTEFGHGLATFNRSNQFPSDFLIYVIKSGHFYSYGKFLNIPMKEISLERKIKKSESIPDPSLLISVKELFRRIPELQPVIREYFNECPLSFHIGSSRKNDSIRLEALRNQDITNSLQSEGFSLENNIERDEAEKVTYVSLYSHNETDITVEQLNGLGLPFFDIELAEDTYSKKTYFEAKVKHPMQGYWWEHLSLYRSSYCATSIISPVFNNIEDVVAVNLMLLYSLSIIVRYLPNLWYEITTGELSIYSSLLEYYLTIFDRVMPKLMLERITEIEIKVSYPGSLTAPL